MTQVKFVELNNKSRKGLYVHVKNKGQRAAYYKYRDGTTLDAYAQYYNRPNDLLKLKDYLQEYQHKTKPRTKRTPISKQTDNYIKKIKRRGTLTKNIKGGITSITIPDILKITTTALHKYKTKMLEPLVLDKEILELIAKPQNFDKLKHRLEYRITLRGKHDQTINANTFNKTPEQILNQLQSNFGINKTIEYPERELKKLGWGTSGKTDRIKITSAKLQIIFRKAG